MSRKTLFVGLGAGCAIVGGYLFARFWALAGTETPADQSGMLSFLDWGTFFISPLFVIASFVLVLLGILSGARRQSAPDSKFDPKLDAQMRALESTH
ncbi:hypothetical protein [Demequina aurantiaca]|uniref:hypothetical protein n=1 Tax=Demequina aurantiaca TaxID=676200 RepID=UPI003D34B814